MVDYDVLTMITCTVHIALFGYGRAWRKYGGKGMGMNTNSWLREVRESVVSEGGISGLPIRQFPAT
jgi:hypothetical protein